MGVKNKKSNEDTWDFGGYATKNDVLCTDGRIIKHNAFIEDDGKEVPIMWMHRSDDIKHVLGKGILENRPDGVYVRGKFNDTDNGKRAKITVKQGAIDSLSIRANRLKQNGNEVVHGVIREVSLVLVGANPKAKIENTEMMHMDGMEINEEEALFLGFAHGLDLTDLLPDAKTVELEHLVDNPDEEIEEDPKDDPAKKKEEEAKHAGVGEKTKAEIFATLSEEQKDVVYEMIATVAEGGIQQSADKGENEMKHNLFAIRSNKADPELMHVELSHADFAKITSEVKAGKGTMREAFIEHAGTYGIDNIEYLFPEAQTLSNQPDFISRAMGWVPKVLAAVHKTPFSRIKTIHADITADEARAKGYIKGAQKFEEVFPLLKRLTTPTTIYKKQKLDRDDIIDIVDLNVVAWVKAEMRMMLDEEIARAILVGDGRLASDPDKIKDPMGANEGAGIRSIYNDNALYAIRKLLAVNATVSDVTEAIIRARKDYKGSGSPTLYTTADLVIDMLLWKDSIGRRYFNTEAEIATYLRVASIIEVEVMENVSRTVGEGEAAVTTDLQSIMVNLVDYNVGADKGGAVTMFEDFDIDFNQEKYLIETRISGALTKPKSAVIFEKARAATTPIIPDPEG